jgi:GT2 family glycosyltransferase
MKASIVITYWNGAEKIKKYLPDVLKFAKENNISEIIASDDASSDNTVNLLKKEFPEVTILEKERNEGFASNANDGFKKANGDFVFLLNSDAAPEKDVLKYAMPHFADPKVFSVGCKVRNGLFATGRFENGFFWHGQAENFKDSDLKPHLTLWSSGGGSIFRKSLWDELKGFDPLFNPFYEEDVDLGYRALKRGYKNIWEPKARVEHYREPGVIAQNFKEETVTKIAQRNQLIFIWKNITSKKLIKEHKIALARMLARHPGYWPIFLSAIKKYPEIMKKREIEKKEEKLSDEEIFSLFMKD